MTSEVVGIIVFSGFMVILIGALVGNLLVALYRERKQRKAAGETSAASTTE
jgi:hypothetical protein